MKGRHARAVLLGAGLLAGGCEVFGAGGSATPVDDAVALYRQKRYGEARDALERLLNADPSNAAACYYLALALEHIPAPSLDLARSWLTKAVQLAPENETYLAEYAGVTLLLAGRDSSMSLAIAGRDAMAKAVAMNPDDLDASEGLMKFHARAPWPLGSASKALHLAAEIAKRDPKRGEAVYRNIASTFEKQGRTEDALTASQAAQRLAQAAGR